MKYRKLHGYKYQTAAPDLYELPPAFSSHTANLSHIILVNRKLFIKEGYAWDGASGAMDTKTIMRGSLAHDALYQLMRQGELTRSLRESADMVLRDMCLQDKMMKLRADYVYNAVRMFGEGATHNGVEKYDKIYTVGE